MTFSVQKNLGIIKYLLGKITYLVLNISPQIMAPKKNTDKRNSTRGQHSKRGVQTKPKDKTSIISKILNQLKKLAPSSSKDGPSTSNAINLVHSKSKRSSKYDSTTSSIPTSSTASRRNPKRKKTCHTAAGSQNAPGYKISGSEEVDYREGSLSKVRQNAWATAFVNSFRIAQNPSLATSQGNCVDGSSGVF